MLGIAWNTVFLMLVLFILQTLVIAALIRTNHRSTLRIEGLLGKLTEEYEYQHDQATLFGSLAGLFRTLAMGDEEGGLPIDVRKPIYETGEKTIKQYRLNHTLRHAKEEV